MRGEKYILPGLSALSFKTLGGAYCAPTVFGLVSIIAGERGIVKVAYWQALNVFCIPY